MKIFAARRGALVLLLVLAAYGYGVVSHKLRLFPFLQVKQLKDLVLLELKPVSEDFGFNDSSGRIRVDCTRFQDKGVAVIMILGQSTADNAGDTVYRPRGEVFNYNFFDGRCYRAVDPLLGATDTGGSPWSRLGDRLVEQGIFRRVLIAPIAVGGSSIRDWIPSDGLYRGPNHRRIIATIEGLRKAGLNLTHIFWQQGETERSLGTATEVYIGNFGKITDSIRAQGVQAPIFVARATLCGSGVNYPIREAQQQIPKRFKGVFRGPDSDQISHFSMRYDGCHMTGRGQDALADAWFKILTEKR